MDLTDRQKLSIKHLHEAGITSWLDIRNWALSKLQQSRYDNGKSKVGRRRHSRQYYKEVIRYIDLNNLTKNPDAATVK